MCDDTFAGVDVGKITYRHECNHVLIVFFNVLSASVQSGGGRNYSLFSAFLGKFSLGFRVIRSEENVGVQVILDDLRSFVSVYVISCAYD